MILISQSLFSFSFLSCLIECPRVSSVHTLSDIYYINSFNELLEQM